MDNLSIFYLNLSGVFGIMAVTAKDRQVIPAKVGGDRLNKKKSANAGAVIEIGTNNVRMRVSQLAKGVVSTLDFLEYPVRLGHDVFETGIVSFDSLRELSEALDKFSSALLSYNLQKPKVISCTALREAKNRSLAADQIRVRNGMEVTVLEDSQEKAYIYSEIVSKLKNAPFIQQGNSVIAYVGSGSIGVALFDGSKAVYFQNVSMGALKLHDILQGMHSASEDFHTLIEEYLDTTLNRISVSGFQVDHLILTGAQIERIAKLCGAKCEEGYHEFSAHRLSEIYDSLRTLTPENVAQRYGITEGEAAVLYTALAIYNAMLRFCPKADTVFAPTADISEAVVRCMLSSKAEAERESFWKKSAVACAETTAGRFGCDLSHSQYIRDTSCRIFDKMKSVHGLDSSKRLILELASILHSCGSFVSVRQHNKCTFDLIKGMDLFGLSEAEVLETAFVAGSISDNLSIEENPDFARLDKKEKLVISKLAAMFRMANALDKSHREKLSDLRVSTETNRVLFKACAAGDTMLEQWAFAESAQYFKDVFGLSPELSIKFELK